jgi:invasion protein IalB
MREPDFRGFLEKAARALGRREQNCNNRRDSGDSAGAVGQGWMMGIFRQKPYQEPYQKSHHEPRAGLRKTAVAFVITLLAVAGFQKSAPAQGVVRSVHQDWQIRCDTPPGAQTEQCALMQSVVAEDRANVGLTVIVLKTADNKSRLLRVIAPLGVLLPAGLGLTIDKQDVGRAGFVRCLPNGCFAEVVMDDNLMRQLRTGQSATFIIFQTPEEGIGFPLSLKGFGEGYDKLP